MNIEHEKYMRMALDLAAKGLCLTRPNPAVGCVVVKNGRVVGQGYHKFCGGPHAEVHALRQSGAKAKGADLYVTLEPCAHWGKTSPCAEAVIKAGIKRVFYAVRDPNPKVNGGGEKLLLNAGVKVKSGILQKESEYLNREFFVNMKQKRPYIVLKQALTLDGKTATIIGDSKWISSSKSRDYVHTLRARSQSIMVGIGTVLKDNPYLTSHGKGSNPIRIAIDKHLDMPLNARFLENNARRLIITAAAKNNKKALKLESMGCEVYSHLLINGNFKLNNVVKELYEKDIMQVLLESGSGLAGSFFDNRIIDEVIYFIAPKIVGGLNAPGSIAGKGISKMSKSAKLENVEVDVIDTDFLIKGTVSY